MLGVRLTEDDERRLTQFARDVGRPKSVIVREWITERLNNESLDKRMRRTAEILGRHERAQDYIEADMDD